MRSVSSRTMVDQGRHVREYLDRPAFAAEKKLFFFRGSRVEKVFSFRLARPNSKRSRNAIAVILPAILAEKPFFDPMV